MGLGVAAPVGLLSLSVRRAWIEIGLCSAEKKVDLSLSVRRAWIEMSCMMVVKGGCKVALREESVD